MAVVTIEAGGQRIEFRDARLMSMTVDEGEDLMRRVERSRTWEGMTEEDRRGVVAAAFAWSDGLCDATRPTDGAGAALLLALHTAQGRLVDAVFSGDGEAG